LRTVYSIYSNVSGANSTRQIGVWLMQKCTEGTVFSPVDHQCRPVRHVRRQVATMCGSPAGCSAQPQFVVQPQQQAQPCPCQAQPTVAIVVPTQPSCMCPGPQVQCTMCNWISVTKCVLCRCSNRSQYRSRCNPNHNVDVKHSRNVRVRHR
jgi:hypothetical protein